MIESNKLLYVYCFITKESSDEDLLKLLEDLKGIATEKVSFEVFTHFKCVYSEVDKNIFQGEEAEARLEDINWIAPQAAIHQKVIQEVDKLAPLLPTKFGTLFSAIPVIHSFLNKHEATIKEFFRTTANSKEWVLKGRLLKEQYVESVFNQRVASHQTNLSLKEGTRYLQEKKIKSEILREIPAITDNFRKGVLDIISKDSLQVHCGNTTLNTNEKILGDLIFNITFLAPLHSLEAIKDNLVCFEELESNSNFKLELSGPWAPFSFVPELTTD